MIMLRCNLCGKEIGFATQDMNDDFAIHTIIGYGSKYDTYHLHIDFCSDCMDSLIDKCVIPPILDPEHPEDPDPRYKIEGAPRG